MRTVFVIQDVNGKNLLPAGEHGKLRVILSGREDPETAMSKLQDAMEGFTSIDFLLLIGSPINIALAAHIALRKLGSVNFLVWDRTNYRYNIERIVT
ncbi:hypothetical protein EPO05_06480 [Patescibacteria group bacterium]|nr:MAG: hypothetical protein EPO05_06480 [Patescibacteria group bacterium]